MNQASNASAHDLPGPEPRENPGHIHPGGYPAEQLILVLGIMPRSGTNYLYDLLLTHADCTASRVPEDFLVAQAHWLNGYVEAVHGKWSPRWGLTPEDL